MNKSKSQKINTMKNRISILLITLLIVLLMVGISGVMAYYWSSTEKVTNEFTPGEVALVINETKSSDQKSDIYFTNPETDNAVPVYVRATLVIHWTEMFDMTDDGIDNSTEQIVPQPAGASIKLGTVKDNWFKVGDIYYYKLSVDPGKDTGVMLTPIEITIPDDSVECHIEVHAEAIQAEPASAVESAWQDVKVDSNGMLVSR